MSADDLDELRELFDFYDRDGNGVIDRDEFARLCRALDDGFSEDELAAGLWSAFEVRLDLGGEPTDAVRSQVQDLPAVRQAVTSPSGLVVRIDGRDDVPAVVAACVGAGATVYRVDPHDPTLEDVYFALEARVLAGAS